MKELLFLFATVTPMEEIISKIKDAATQESIAPSEKNMQELQTWCMMLLAKKTTGDTPEGLERVLKQMKKSEAQENLFTDRKS